MNNIPNNPTIKVETSGNSGLFCNYVYKAIPLAFDESMSYYECLCGLLSYLKDTVIPTVNNNADAVVELQNLYVELKDYVDNYFINLDVQEEINNKLDELVKDGTLSDLIEKYINPYIDIQNQKIETIESKVNSLSSGSPKGVYETYEDLVSNDPDHNYIYVVKDTGEWYFYDTNTSSWKSGGTYQSTNIGNETVSAQSLTTNLKNALNIGYPLFTETKGKYRMTTGYEVEQQRWVITSPIKLLKNETIQFFGKGYNQVVSMISVVNQTNTFIKNVATSTDSNINNYKYTTKEECYVSLCYLENTVTDLIIYANNDDIVANSIENYDFNMRGIEIGNIEANKYIGTNGAVYDHPYGSYSVTDFIKVSPNSNYILKNIDWTSTDNNVGYAFYDENKKFLSWFVNTQTKDINYKTPNNVYYVRHTLKTLTVDNTSLSLNETIKSLNETINNVSNNINGLFASFEKFTVIGDSLASGESVAVQDGQAKYIDNYFYSWGQYIARKYGIECVNLSAGGLTTRSWLTAGDRGLDGLLKKENKSKAYIIALGTNDYATLGETYIGNKDDIDMEDFNNNADTFYGNYGKIIQNIKKLYPKAKIFITTMPKQTPTQNIPVKDLYNEAIREISTLFTNCYLIDLTLLNNEYTTGLIYSSLRGGHYNAIGYNYISQLIDNMLNDYMINNQTEFNQIEFINTDYNY